MAKTALDASRENLWLLDPDEIVIVGYDTKDGLEHPLVNERVMKLKREGFSRPGLVASLIAEGQQQNIVVRKNGDKVECVVGRNRVLAGREVKKQLRAAGDAPSFFLRSVLRKDNDESGLTGAIEAENRIRHDDDMLTSARNARRLLSRGESEEVVARKMGMTLEVLKNHLRVLELSPKMQGLVEKGLITATAAATYADMSQEEQDAKIAAAIEAGVVISVPEARRQRAERGRVKRGQSKNGPSLRGKGISVSVLRKVHANEEFVGGLDHSARALLAWIIGEDGSWDRKVPGLRKALRDAGVLSDAE